MNAMRALSTPARILLGIGALAAGVALIIAPLSVRQISILTGLGVMLVGLVVALQRRTGIVAAADFPGVAGGRISRAFGALLAAMGAVIALWPMVGAPWIAGLVGAALVLHGLISVAQAFRGGAPSRASEAISGAASLLFGILVFSWPVLTLSVFRLGVGAWLVFLALHSLLEFVLGRRSRGRPATSRFSGWMRVLGASLALAVAVLFSWGSGVVLGGARLAEPGSFYAIPGDLPKEPGQLLRFEPLTEGVPNGAKAWRILYTTTDSDGAAAVSSGTVLAPANPGADPLPLLSVAHGTTGVVSKCAPSLSAAPFADGAGTALAEMVTEHGWLAVISDYVGLGTEGTHPYLVGDAEARNVLDASRAVQQLKTVTTGPETVVWGHSQGGQAALWTGQVAADYAPDLKIKGVAAFAPAADLLGLAEADKDEAAGKTVSAYIASTWDRLYPDLQLEKHLTPGSARPVEKIHDLCFNGSDVLAAVLRGSQVPNQIFPDSLLDGGFGRKLVEQTPVGPFPAPVMVAQGLADPLVKPAMQQKWVTARCESGEKIDYRTFPGLDHNSLVSADSPLTPEIVQWTLDRWDGQAAESTCG